MKQGGVSWNTGGKSKSGLKTRSQCSICGRQYKQVWTKDSHESGCKEFNHIE